MLKNVSKVLSGGLLSQILNFLSVPLITSWYEPAAMGAYAGFAFFVAFLPMIMSLRMEMAIMQDPCAKDQNALVFLAILSGGVILTFCIASSVIFNPELRKEVILIGFCSFFASISNMAISIANLKERYWAISISRALFPILFFVIVFFLKDTEAEDGLAASHTLATFFGMLFIVLVSGYRVRMASLGRLIHTLRKNIDYARFDLPSNILNVGALLLPAFLLGILFDDEAAGLYFLAYKLVAAPLSAISQAFGFVYRREAVREFKISRSFEVITKKSLVLLSTLSMLMLIGFYTLGPLVFELLFRKEWLEALPILSVLMPMFAIKLVSSSLSFSFYIVNRLKLDLYGQVFFVVSVACAIYGGYLINDFMLTIYLISITSAMTYLFYGIKSIQFSRGV